MVDCIEALPHAAVTDRSVEKVIRMVAVSERVSVDGASRGRSGASSFEMGPRVHLIVREQPSGV